ncbi:hypothetical protein RBWH47_03468 [Rhodopirellula baltica WH47]|uniref:Uncharacterized protein n=2 Tax=Rhodopirellula baltica TaxID=265606 RepID=F2ALM0_RHOBT|nr:hypothetical protein RBWH47_03468 [Rhodopirellula baltica WH47]
MAEMIATDLYGEDLSRFRLVFCAVQAVRSHHLVLFIRLIRSGA